MLLNGKSGPVANPRHADVASLVGTIVRLRRTLALSALGHSAAAEPGKRRSIKEQEASVIKSVHGDDLLARPLVEEPLVSRRGNSRPPARKLDA